MSSSTLSSDCVIYIFVILIFLIGVNKKNYDDLLINTNVGQIRGLRATDGYYTMFMGIPYGVVEADNPFGAASPYPKFDDVFEAYDDSAICPQIEEFNLTITGSLDCLHINVYVPDRVTNERLPVLVWIYGCTFNTGFAGRFLYGPNFLVRHDIILVTLNYRLGPYGFMCLDIPEVPGNQGLKDQHLAMKWVKDNIVAFGGDADRITIAGNSAGAMAVDLHVLSEYEKVYDKAILQSGNSFSLSFSEPNRRAPITIASHLDFDTDDLHEAIAFLASVDPHAVITAVEQLSIKFWPCIENKFDGIKNFIGADWKRTDKMPKAENMSFLMGFNDAESLIHFIFQDSEFFKNTNIVENVLRGGFDVDHEDFSGMVKVIHNFYFGDGQLDESMRWQVIDFHSDMSFVHPTHRSLKRYIDNGAEKVYFYKFSYAGERNFLKYMQNITNIGGASHADEIGYLFDIVFMPQSNAEDQLIIDRMTTLWANFVKHNDPTPETSELLPQTWQPITNDSQYHYLTIDSELSVGTRPYNQRMAFWDLFCKANYDLQLGPERNNEDSHNAPSYASLNLFLTVSFILIMIIINY